MNCIDFRRRVLTNPRQLGEEAREHALACAACREFLDKQREMDAELFAAMQVAPPDGLADRILVARGLRRRRWIWPIAAAIVLATGAAALWPLLSPADPLGREAITHVALEPQSFSTVTTVPGDFLPALLSEQGVKMAKTVGQVTYARICPMAGRVARHLVMRTTDGAVTIFLLPDDPNRRQRAVTQRDGMAAITIPAAKGTIAIVANSLDQVLAFEKALRAT